MLVFALGSEILVPPEIVIAPEAAPKIIGPEFGEPLTVMVPAPKPTVGVPKFSLVSEVAVVTAAKALAPVALVDQPATVPAVGAAQVPVDAPAVPKPVPAALSSQ